MAIKFLSSGNVTGGLTLSGALSGTSATFTGTGRFEDDLTIYNSSPEMYYLTSSASHYNWMVAAQENVDGAFEITPSNAVGTGGVFNTPAFRLDASTRNATFAGTVDGQGFRTTSGSTDYSLLTRNSTNTAVYIQQAGSGNIVDFRYGSQAAGQGTSAMIIKDTGEVAIGANFTGYDGQILAVDCGTADTVLYGQSSDANCFASFRDNSSTANIEYGAIGNAHVFRKDATEKMRIAAPGAVGIDNSSPDSFSGGGSTAASLVIGKGTSGVSPHITLWQGNSAQAAITFASANTGAGQYEGRIRYTRDTGIMDFRTNGVANALVLGSTGNVGIGGTPGQNLDIQKSGARFRLIDGTNQLNMGLWDGANYRFEGDANRPIYMTSYQGNIYFGISGGTTMTIQSGSVGIGTTSPGSKLDIGTSSGASMQFLYDTSQTYRNNISNYWNSSTDSRMDFNIGRTANVAPVTIMSVGYAGNVGIGTTSPTSKLTINGQVQVGPDAARRYALQPSQWGYASSYRTLILGSASTTYNTNNTGSVTLAFGVDVSANPSGSFTGNGSECIFRNGAKFITPNAANNGYNSNTIVLKDQSVGIGIAPGNGFGLARLSVGTGAVANEIISFAVAGGGNAELRNTSSSGTFTFTNDDGSSEKMRIKANGQIDFASPGTPNQSGISMFGGASGGIMYMYRPVGQNGDIIRFQTATSSTSSTRVGYINTTSSATTYNSASDYRLKENVTKITNALDRVSKLKPSRFNFIIEPKNTVDGFIAHEVQKIVPEAVTGVKDEIDENGNNHYQGMDNARLVPLLTAAIQELKAEIEILKKK